MNLAELCRLISLPPDVAERVLAFDAAFDYSCVDSETGALQSRATWDQAVKEIQRRLGDDEQGVKLLACLLHCALQARKAYLEKGIPEAIFIDTFKFFTRFVEFHREVYGFPAFAWGWWVPRQIALNEFRIGALEYEIVETDASPKIQIHIASDSDLSPPRLRESYLDARRFFARFFPDHAGTDMYCESWLLCPALVELLPPASKILAFQRSFEVYKVDTESDGFMQWVYGRKDIPLEELPESTSLQRAVKARLLAGGKVGWAYGKLVDDPFTE